MLSIRMLVKYELLLPCHHPKSDRHSFGSNQDGDLFPVPFLRIFSPFISDRSGNEKFGVTTGKKMMIMKD